MRLYRPRSIITSRFTCRRTFGKLENTMREAVTRSEPVDDVAVTDLPADAIVLDVERRLALILGTLVRLSPRECTLVELFGRYRGVVLTKEWLLERLQAAESESFGETVVIDVQVARLRRKFFAAGLHRSVRMVWGRGYRSTCHVRLARLIPPPAGGTALEEARLGTTDAVGPETGHQTSIGADVTKRFAEAARQAIQQAHARGLAVPVRRDGVPVELRPDGSSAPIDNLGHWQPTDWKSKPAS